MGTQAVTAITNFAFSFEIAFFAGMLLSKPAAKVSAYRYWSWAMLLLGLAALLGGIDHAFLEAEGSRGAITPLTHPTWLVLGIMTFFVLMATARHFFSASVYRVVRWIAALQLALFVVLLFGSESFLLVMLNYGPVILLMLGSTVVGIRSGKGSWQMALGISILVAASVVQALAIDVLDPLDRNGLYHLISMIGIPFLYLGGLKLERSGSPSEILQK